MANERPLGRYPMWGGRSPGEAFGARRRAEPTTRRYPAIVIRDLVGLVLLVAGALSAAVGAGMVLGPGGVFLVVGVVMVVVGVLLGTGGGD